MTVQQFVEQKMKALVGALVAAIVGYVGTALSTGTALTLHGLEVAAAGAVLTFAGVHTAPKNKEPVKRSTRPVAKRAKDAGDAMLVTIAAILIIVCAVIYLINHAH